MDKTERQYNWLIRVQTGDSKSQPKRLTITIGCNRLNNLVSQLNPPHLKIKKTQNIQEEKPKLHPLQLASY